MMVPRMWTRAMILSMKWNDAIDNGKSEQSKSERWEKDRVGGGLTFRSNSFNCSIKETQDYPDHRTFLQPLDIPSDSN